MKKGRYQDAYASFKRLRNTELQAARDLYYVHRQLMEEFAALRGSNYITRFTELFTVPRVRRATLAAFVVMIAQQVTEQLITRPLFVLTSQPDVWYGCLRPILN